MKLSLALLIADISVLACRCVQVTNAVPAVRKPPMGWSSWNYLGTGPSAELLIETANAFASTGLRDNGYLYIIATEGWNLPNRTGNSPLQPAPTFTNSTVRALADELHSKGFKFGIYGAAAFTTCAHRAGSLYHERQDAAQYKAWGVDYLKYDDCGEANIQSYVKYFVMKDALEAAPGGGLDYYSYEPFQIYAAGAVEQMVWVSRVGDLWRSSNDIRPSWESILSNAFLTNKWARNARLVTFTQFARFTPYSLVIMSQPYMCLPASYHRHLEAEGAKISEN
jgi:alpha-galactosidase